MEPDQITTDMRFINNFLAPPKSIRVSTTYNPTRDEGVWETIVSYQEEVDPDEPDYCNPIIREFRTKINNPKQQHETIVNYYKSGGYEVVKHFDSDEVKLWNKKLEGIPGLDLADITQKELNHLEFVRYLREKGKI